ncbi:MAG: thioesterase family protein, partial [Pseudomonadota bacterium]
GSNEQQQINLQDRSVYRAWTSHSIRYNDLDPLGHVNNAVYSTFVEAGRTALLQPLFKEHAHLNLDTVLVRTVLDFHKELRYPGEVDIGTGVQRIGNTSVVFINGIFQKGTDVCHASGEAYLVFFDLIERKSTRPPQVFRDVLEGIMV